MYNSQTALVPAVVVLIGGNGSNLQALIDHPAHGIAYRIAGVISHRPGAYGLERAQRAQIPACVIDHQAYTDRGDFEAALITAAQNFSPQCIVMAGFMRILSPLFIQHFAGKILNIHPSLLPKYKGLHTHQRALDAKEKEHGVSVHFVTEALDGGPIIAQVPVPILENDDATTLAQRVHHAEHWLYPQIVAWFAEKRLTWDKNEVILDDKQLPAQGITLKGIVS